MLDLKKMEENLDKALSQETSISLTDWLLVKRDKQLNSFLENENTSNNQFFNGELEEFKES